MYKLNVLKIGMKLNIIKNIKTKTVFYPINYYDVTIENVGKFSLCHLQVIFLTYKNHI